MIKVSKKIYMKVLAIFMLITVGIAQVGDILTQSLYASEKTMTFSYTGGTEKVFYNKAYNYNTSYRRAKLDDYTAYCLDYGRQLPEGTMKYKRELSAKATSVLMAGYPNRTASEIGVSTAKEAYLATQLALWNTVTSTGDSKTGLDLDYSNLVAVSGEESLFNTVKTFAKKIQAHAEANPYNPSFSLKFSGSKAKTTNSDGNIVVGPYTLSMSSGYEGKSAKVSLSNAPSSAKTTDKNGNAKTTFTEGEGIYVTMNGAEKASTLKLSATVSGYDYIGAVYGNSNSSEQDYVTAVKKATSDDASISVSWESASGSLKILKVDNAGNKVTGAKFEVRNSNNTVIANITTDTNGSATVENLNVGTYKLVETYAPSGYILNSSPITVEVTGGTTTTKTVVNQKEQEKTGNIQIIKVDQYGNRVTGAKFELRTSSNFTMATGTTDTNGIIGFENLAVGNYTLVETYTPSNYILDQTPIYVTVTSGSTATKTVTNYIKTVTQAPPTVIYGNFKITKVDDSGNPISNVKFDLYNSSRVKIATMITDTNGVSIVSNLTTGTYYYKEVEVPNGVIIDNNEYSFNISSSGTIERTIVNKLQKGTLKIVKVDESGNYLSQVKFNILDSNKNKIATITTGTDGVASISDLANGTYYYQEISAPESVILDTNQYPFTIDNTNKYIEKRVVNNLIKGNLKIIKVDDLGNKVSGVKFEILDLSMNVLDTIVTGQDGVATSKSLAKGKYYYREVEAPSNLIFDKQVYAFTISKTGEVITKEIVNETQKGSLQIIKMDDYKNPVQGAKFNILDSSKKVIQTITTDKNGIANTSNLPVGSKYYYKEVSVPNNVIIDSNEYEFVVQNGIIQKNVTNVLKKSKLQIIKLDKNTKSPIANVKFEILNESKQVVDTITTDSQGNAYSKDLVIGKYYYKEVSVPDTYKIDSKEYDFNIKDNNQDVQKVVYNSPKGALPTTGSAFGANIGIVLVVTGIGIIGYVFIASSKYKKKVL